VKLTPDDGICTTFETKLFHKEKMNKKREKIDEGDKG
jgi:hypothetical protein